MSRLTDRLERDLREIAAGAHPSPSAWQSIVARFDDDAESEVLPMLSRGPDKSKRLVWRAVAAAVLVGITGAVAVLARVGDDQAVSVADLDLTTTFVSPRNGFSVKYSDRGKSTVRPAKQLWGFGEKVDDGFDVVETGSAAVFKGASTVWSLTERPAAGSIDAHIDEYLSIDHILPDGCGIPRRQQAEITIDGQPGRTAECPNHIEATVVVGLRLYLFTLSHDRADARSVFGAFVDTIDLTPETAVDFPAMTTTFVSPTYGYSFKYHDRGGLARATELWDPGNRPFDRFEFDPQFDGVETGLGNYFKAASTKIPNGVSIDQWVDQYVLSACGVPRRKQAEITIDGRLARIAACHQIEATVVAGGRLYLFIGGENRAWFNAWIATIDLTPETATPRSRRP